MGSPAGSCSHMHPHTAPKILLSHPTLATTGMLHVTWHHHPSFLNQYSFCCSTSRTKHQAGTKLQAMPQQPVLNRHPATL